MKYLFSDVETSGRSHTRHSLLQAYFAVYDENLEYIDELDLFLKPDEGDHTSIVFEPEALKITGIDLLEHCKNPNTITYSAGKKKVLEFLTKYKTPNKRKHFRLSGHNVEFDKNFIKAQLVEEEEWEKLVHYNTIDTLRICTFLQDVGFIPSDLGSLGSLVEYFNIPMGKAHNAREDIKMTVELYRSFRKMMQDKKDGISGVSENSLLSIVEM